MMFSWDVLAWSMACHTIVTDKAPEKQNINEIKNVNL